MERTALKPLASARPGLAQITFHEGRQTHPSGVGRVAATARRGSACRQGPPDGIGPHCDRAPLLARAELNEGLVSLTNADFDQWVEYRESFSAIDLAGRLGVDADEAYRRGEQLLMRARSIDPLGPWHHVVRHGDRRSQDRLTGGARLALDHRRAAELMLLSAGDLDGKLRALAPPRRVWHPTDDRLMRHGEALDEALIDLGVSPHPRVLLILKGETEGILARKVLDHLSLRLRDDEPRIVLMRGVTQKSRILKSAAEAATPAIGEAARDHYSLRRPPTRIVVATDPERPMQDPTVFETVHPPSGK